MRYHKTFGTDINTLRVEPTLKDTWNSGPLIKASQQFSINRPSFLSGVAYTGKTADSIKNINHRNGTGNYNIERHNFMASPIAPITLDFDKLQALDIQNNGMKVQLSDKTLNELLNIQVPDPTDVDWIREEQRLRAVYAAKGLNKQQIDRELEVNKPLGREQRKINRRQAIGSSELTMGQKLEELLQEVKDGRIQSATQKADILTQIALMMTEIKNIENLSATEFRNIVGILQTMNVLPRDHKSIGLVRFHDNNSYLANAGLINLYLISGATYDPKINFNTPVRNFDQHPNGGLPPIKITTMVGNLSTNAKFLDLEHRGIINQTQLLQEAKGFPQGLLDANIFSINPANLQQQQAPAQINKPATLSNSRLKSITLVALTQYTTEWVIYKTQGQITNIVDYLTTVKRTPPQMAQAALGRKDDLKVL